ncbi:O-antigen/teichoic acid export membrane protein [Variovorax paradoxus]|uniref:oligosaccharide flippase family protein n=1 Tax=Variovorax paradoxus TaxID=34073 RepID=UPI00277F97BC|nr:oligosaccharide flippase family protein [Variovorax paradoxus]MDQ0024194.1 O-antigen/teichoic acid export membrane protein [Variovorax paradoxus]
MLKKILRSAAVLASGTAGGQLFVVAVSPVLTRLYSPAEFGIFGVYAAVLYMMLSFSSLRYEVAIPLVKSEEDARHLAAAAIFITLSVSILLIPAAFSLQLVDPSGAWRIFQWLLPLGVATAGIYNVFTYVRLRSAEQGVVAKTRVLQSIAGSVFQVASGFLNGGAVGLILGQIVGVSLGVSTLSRSSFISHVKLIFQREKLLAQMRVQKNFAIYDAPAALLAVANTHAPVLLLASLFSPAAAGMYALVQRIFVAPLGLISAALSASLISLGREIKADGNEIFLQKQFLLFRIMAPLATVSALAAFQFFSVVFGAQWGAAGPVAAWVVLFVGQKFAFDAVFSMHAIQGRQREGFFSQLGIFLARFSLLLISANVFTLDVSLGIFSLASTIVYLLALRLALDKRNRVSLANWVFCLVDVTAPYALVAGFLLVDLSPERLVSLSLLYAIWGVSRIAYPVLRTASSSS